MNHQAIQLFNYNNHDMRVVEVNEEPWIVAKDVCDILELSNSRKAVQRVDPEDLMSLEVTSGGQRRQMNAVNESGFYALVFDSRTPGAKKFKRWVTSEVLPSIRKTGGYGPSTNPKMEQAQLDVLMRGIGMLEQSFALMGTALERLADQNQRLEPKPRRKIKQAEREEIFRLHAEGHGPTPIADALDLQPGTVSSIISRARKTGDLDQATMEFI